MLKDYFTRDNSIWAATVVLSVLTYLAADQTGMVPEAYIPLVKNWAALVGVVAAALRSSPLRGDRDVRP